MKQLTFKQQSWLKTLHIFFAVAWVGGQLCLMLLSEMLSKADYQLHYPILLAIREVDDIMIVSGAMGCLFTGLLFGIFTKWGFFKYTWLKVKWVATIALILFGTFCLGSWVNNSVEIARAGLLAMEEYNEYHHLIMLYGTLQTIITISLIVISIFKPNRK